jgi:orotidine-5'-phosphate decarboxylase
MSEAKGALYLALDIPSARAAEPLVKQLGADVDGFKVGGELFLAEGPAICDLIVGVGASLFIDLKLHDIPRSVEAGAKRLAKLGARFITVHALGGSEMLEAAVQGASANSKTQVLAVTVLTSHNEKTLIELGLAGDVEAQVLKLGELAMAAKVPGLVCSVHEVPALRKRLGADPVLVTPGIRLDGGATHDQKRGAAPKAALAAGANVLVVGRAILDAPDRQKALQQVRAEMAS